MKAVSVSSIVRSSALAVALSASLGVAASTGALADATGFTPPATDAARAAEPRIATGWHTRYCDYVWAYQKNGATVVEIVNDNGSKLWYSGDTEKPSVYQEMLIRACYKPGARYQFRVYNSNGNWDAVRAY